MRIKKAYVVLNRAMNWNRDVSHSSSRALKSCSAQFGEVE